MLSMPALEDRTLRVANRAAPGVTRVALLAPLTVVVAVDKQDDDDPRRIIDALVTDIYAKQVIVVDADVDPTDLWAVLGALALQRQPDQAVRIMTGLPGTPLDPSCTSADGKTAKLGIDATRPLVGRESVTRNRIPEDVLQRVDLAALRAKK